MKVASLFILLSFVFVQCVQEQDDSKVNKPKETTGKEVEKDDVDDRSGIKKYTSTDLGVQEYLEIRSDEKGYTTWFYSSEKNQEPIEMGNLSRNAVDHIYFFGKPDEKYYIGFEQCGFILTDSKNNEEQWYRQTEPKCGL